MATLEEIERSWSLDDVYRADAVLSYNDACEKYIMEHPPK